MKRMILAALLSAAMLSSVPVSRGQSVTTSIVPLDRSDPLTLSDGEHAVHVFPTASWAAELGLASASGPLVYHGGPVMEASATTYAIFWLPSRLQNGNSTSMSQGYQPVLKAFLTSYPGHGIGNNNTQYYDSASFIQNTGRFAGSYVDNSSYPASGCTDPATPGNCISDAQVQAEIQRVMALKGWTGGLGNMFLLFTSSGEGSCMNQYCAYTSYCAYHGYFSNGSSTVIYGNEPYAAAQYCHSASTSPNNDPDADAAANIASHELTEAITDPELNAWYTAQGDYEIGDLCAAHYGPNTWDGGKANQEWVVGFLLGGPIIGDFELQEEYDNHVSGCVQLGP